MQQGPVDRCLSGPYAPLHISTGGGDYWYHVDPIGSVRALTDQSWAPIGTYRYSALGEVLETSGPYNRLRFTARPYDAAIDAHDLRAREYDGASGRFIQRDPRACATARTSMRTPRTTRSATSTPSASPGKIPSR